MVLLNPQDAVIVIPGIMGSSLYDTETCQWRWGLDDLRWYVRAWSPLGPGLTGLRLTGHERGALDEAGTPAAVGSTGLPDYRRVKPMGLLRFPAHFPVLAGFEPYTDMISKLRKDLAHPRALLEFPYDWRLPVRYNARLLAWAAAKHLAWWRSRPEHDAARRRAKDDRPARLVLVAHSMGGLLARALALDAMRAETGLTAHDIRTTVTLGTPFHGSVKAAVILADGSGAPLPPGRLRRLAATLPGLYDLLPTDRCVDLGNGARHLTAADVVSIGGDPDLFSLSAVGHDLLSAAEPIAHRSLVGRSQPTLASVALNHGSLRPSEDSLWESAGGIERRPLGGDGTVSVTAALHSTPAYLSQQHGALARDSSAIDQVSGIFSEPDAPRRPDLGTGEVGLRAPDVVTVGTEWSFSVTGGDGQPKVTCALYDLTGPRRRSPSRWLRPTREDGTIRGRLALPAPGLYRLELHGTGGAPISQLVLALPP